MTTVNTTEATASANVSAVVRMLLAGRGEKFDVLVPVLGTSRTTTFDKIRGRSKWYADEVQCLADFFGIPITTFYGGSAALLPTSCDYWVNGLNELVPSQTNLFDLLPTADSAAA